MGKQKTINQLITDFIELGVFQQEIDPLDKILKTNELLRLLKKEDFQQNLAASDPLPERLAVLDQLIEYAVQEKVIEDIQAAHEILGAEIMSLITPLTSEVNRQFWERYVFGPQAATDYFYQLSQSNDYIKTRSIAKNIQFYFPCEFGKLEITINLSKPEKDPKQIALEKHAGSSGYPICLLCMENEGYAGRVNHPARSNHRIVRMLVNKECWGLQYSPYAYYNEHCIFLSEVHKPMKVEKATFSKLLGIVEQFPHYFVGSNADLPIVGGSILSHDHYQGGRHTFAMAEAEVNFSFPLDAFPMIEAGVVNWPMSVIRLKSADKEAMIEAAAFILEQWRGYSDKEAAILAYTGEVPHNTITPIARRKGTDFELDLVLRNNRTSEEFPDGIFHPHPDVQHIKKENVGLIEVMGLAILPPRLKTELQEVEQYLLDKPNDLADSHKEWANVLKAEKQPTAATVHHIVEEAVGEVFLRVLEDAGVYKQTLAGQTAFKRFIKTLQ